MMSLMIIMMIMFLESVSAMCPKQCECDDNKVVHCQGKYENTVISFNFNLVHIKFSQKQTSQ